MVLGVYGGGLGRKAFLRGGEFQVNNRVSAVGEKVKTMGLFDVGY